MEEYKKRKRRIRKICIILIPLSLVAYVICCNYAAVSYVKEMSTLYEEYFTYNTETITEYFLGNLFMRSWFEFLVIFVLVIIIVLNLDNKKDDEFNDVKEKMDNIIERK